VPRGEEVAFLAPPPPPPFVQVLSLFAARRLLSQRLLRSSRFIPTTPSSVLSLLPGGAREAACTLVSRIELLPPLFFPMRIRALVPFTSTEKSFRFFFPFLLSFFHELPVQVLFYAKNASAFSFHRRPLGRRDLFFPIPFSKCHRYFSPFAQVAFFVGQSFSCRSRSRSPLLPLRSFFLSLSRRFHVQISSGRRPLVFPATPCEPRTPLLFLSPVSERIKTSSSSDDAFVFLFEGFLVRGEVATVVLPSSFFFFISLDDLRRLPLFPFSQQASGYGASLPLSLLSGG